MENCFLYDNCNHKDCGGFCLRRYKLEYLFKASNLTVSQRKHISLRIDSDGTDLAAFRQLAQIEQNIEDFVEAGHNLYIHSSNCGNGKTSWAVRMIQRYLDMIWPDSDLRCRALFINMPDFLQDIKDNMFDKEYINELKRNIREADLVVWDDIATKIATGYEIDSITGLLDRRIRDNKTNIYTSNLNDSEIAKALGERLASRICNESINIELHGADKRGFGGNN